MTDESTARVAIFNCANLAAAGVMLRGKRVSGDWQVHRVGCRDLTDLLRLSRGRLTQYFASVAEARAEFNADMGPGGTAGFSEEEGGWDFDRDCEIKPCTKGL
jgi:hypothetical protein